MVTVAETNARWEKSTAFAAHLFASGIKSADVAFIDAATWKRLGLAIGVNKPHSVETVDTITRILRTFEAARARMENESAAQTVDLSNL